MNQTDKILIGANELHQLELNLVYSLKWMHKLGDIDNDWLDEGIKNIKEYVSQKLEALHIN